MGQQTQNFVIAPNGRIKGGTATYTADLVTGNITYQADVKVGIAFITKTFSQAGSYLVDPAILKSARWCIVGDEVSIQGVNFVVQSVVGTVAKALVTVDNQPMQGTAEIDLSAEYIQINELIANATVMGFNLIIELQKTLAREHEKETWFDRLLYRFFDGM